MARSVIQDPLRGNTRIHKTEMKFHVLGLGSCAHTSCTCDSSTTLLLFSLVSVRFPTRPCRSWTRKIKFSGGYGSESTGTAAIAA